MSKLDNLKHGRKFEKGDPRTVEAAKKSARSRVANLNMQRTMQKILGAQPELTEKMIKSMQQQGLDIGDTETRTTAAMMALVVVNKALKGDLQAAKLALEMAGQVTDAKTVTERERLRIERQKLKLLERGPASGIDAPIIIDTRPDADPEPETEPEDESEAPEE